MPYYNIDNLRSNRSIGSLIKRCGVLMTKLAERRFAAQTLSFTQWLVLETLSRHEHVSATTLSENICYDMGALTRIVDGLQSDGLVRRKRSKQDRRAVEIALTPEGRRHLQGGKHIVVELLNELVAPYTRQEFNSLIGMMQRMLLRLQELQPQEQIRARPTRHSADTAH